MIFVKRKTNRLKIQLYARTEAKQRNEIKKRKRSKNKKEGKGS